MSDYLTRVLERKIAFRKKMAAMPIAEKLRTLDAFRERSVTLRRATFVAQKTDQQPH